MHPILEYPRRIAWYLAAWTPLLVLLASVLWASGGMTFLDAVAILTPACIVYAFACLSPWYICGTQPLRLDNWQGLAVTFGGASVVCSLVLVGGAWLTASAIAPMSAFSGLEQRLHGHLA